MLEGIDLLKVDEEVIFGLTLSVVQPDLQENQTGASCIILYYFNSIVRELKKSRTDG